MGYESRFKYGLLYHTSRSRFQQILYLDSSLGKVLIPEATMGISGAPDIFQEKMSGLMAGLEFVRTYLNDVLVLTKISFQDHLKKICEVLIRLCDLGLKANAPKCKFCTTEVEYLG